MDSVTQPFLTSDLSLEKEDTDRAFDELEGKARASSYHRFFKFYCRPFAIHFTILALYTFLYIYLVRTTICPFKINCGLVECPTTRSSND